MEKKIQQEATAAIKRKLFPGCVIGVFTPQGKYIFPYGYHTYENKQKMEHESIFDVASITKSIPTACLALYLLEKKKIFLHTKVKEIIPELSDPLHENTTLFHLLTHTLDFSISPSLASHKDKSPDALLQIIYTAPLRTPPGTSFLYANATSILLGILIERISGKQLSVLAQEIFFTPLHMNTTTFHPELLLKKPIVPTERDVWRGEVQGVVHDESAYALQKKYVVGSAGLFSTAPDLVTFLEMLLMQGTHNGHQYLSKKIIAAMTLNQITSFGMATGLGWEIGQHRYMGAHAQSLFGKTGFTGCVIMGNMKTKSGVVILSNYHYPTRKKDILPLHVFRAAIADIVFGTL